MKSRYFKWFRLVVFQALFGLAIFIVTRDFYMQRSTEPAGPPHAMVSARAQPVVPGSEYVTVEDAKRLFSVPKNDEAGLDGKDYQEMVRMADERFRAKDYAQAAKLYESALAGAPGNVDIYNNLGLTLSYIDRSTEAVEYLERGASIDQGHQRIWLTLGFVQARIGNTNAARRALQRAVEIDATSSIGIEANRIMANLP